jgi:hypothetical protein
MPPCATVNTSISIIITKRSNFLRRLFNSREKANEMPIFSHINNALGQRPTKRPRCKVYERVKRTFIKKFVSKIRLSVFANVGHEN